MSAINPEAAGTDVGERIAAAVEKLMGEGHPNMVIVAPSENHELIVQDR